jgi:hypothetical protein
VDGVFGGHPAMLRAAIGPPNGIEQAR